MDSLCVLVDTCQAVQSCATSRSSYSELWPCSPQMRGIQVMGLVSCTLIFQGSISSLAPFMPSICRTPAFFSSLAGSVAGSARTRVRLDGLGDVEGARGRPARVLPALG